MATIEQLSNALIKADAAGDTEGATILAREIRRMKADEPAVAETTNEPEDPRAVWSGAILPISEDQYGNTFFDSNAGIIGGLKRAITGPGRALSGELEVMGPDGNVSMEAIGEGLNFAGAFTPASTALRAGERAIPGALNALKRQQPKAPSAEELRAASKAGYEQVRNSGVDYSSTAVQNLAQKMKVDLEADGFLPGEAPRTHAILDALSSPPDGSVASISGLESARRAFRNVGRDFNKPADQAASGRVAEGLERFISEPDPKSVVAGPAADTARALKDARGNYAAAKRSEALGRKEDVAKLRAAAANSGQNIGNTIRQKVVEVLADPKQRAGYSDAELKALRQVAEGSVAANVTRAAGNALGGGGGMGSAVAAIGTGGGAALATGNPYLVGLGLAAPVAGNVSKRASNALTMKAFREADELVRQRSPLYAKIAETPGFKKLSPEGKASMMRAILLSEQARANQTSAQQSERQRLR